MVEKTSKKIKGPDYNRIYKDLIEKKFPEMRNEYSDILLSKELTFFEIVKLNKLLFGEKNKEQEFEEHRYRAYDKQTILRILRYQQKEKLNNSQLAIYFKLSVNTIARWKKIFNNYIATMQQKD